LEPVHSAQVGKQLKQPIESGNFPEGQIQFLVTGSSIAVESHLQVVTSSFLGELQDKQSCSVDSKHVPHKVEHVIQPLGIKVKPVGHTHL